MTTKETNHRSQLMIEAKEVGKCYQIYAAPIDRLKQAICRGKRTFFQEFWALKSLSVEIYKGETLGIIGTNGSGKSTLLQLICGILHPTIGELSIKGRIAALLELGAGFNQDYTGRENIRMNASILGLSKKEIDAQLDSIINFANVGPFIDQPVKTYSSGMYVRLAFAIAIHLSPDILIVDEALAVGDIRFQQKCINAIKTFSKTGTVIFVSHDMGAILELSSRVLWLENGQIKMNGNPKKVAENYLKFIYEGDNRNSNNSNLDAQPIKKNIPSDKFFQPISADIRQFGNLQAKIEAVGINSCDSKSIAYSGSPCDIGLLFYCAKQIQMPIISYMIRDRLGRDIFGDNTSLMHSPLEPFNANQKYQFKFMIEAWPNLAEGEYTICFGIADGTIENHLQCHVLYDAIIVHSLPVKNPTGFFSVLNTKIELQSVA